MTIRADRRMISSYQPFPELSPTEYAALRADIEKRGVQIPAEVDEDGNTLDGHHRQQICRELGIECPTIVRRFGSEEEKRDHVIQLNLARRHLAPHQWGQVFGELLAERGVSRGRGANQGLSATVAECSRELGVSERTARHRLKLAENYEALAPDRRRAVDEGELTIEQARQPHVSNNSGESEWYTPQEYTDAARRVMGSIDLDPASTAAANESVGATKFYTLETDGLTRTWSGNVWLNPPYSQPAVGKFASMLLESVSAGDVTQACVLINNGTETAYFQELARGAPAICFPRGRVKFWHPDRTAAPLQGQAVLYFGDRGAEFVAEFSAFGFVVETAS